MDNEDIRLVAESLGLEVGGNADEVSVKEKGSAYYEWQIFNPLENWSDCGLVLEALVKHCAGESTAGYLKIACSFAAFQVVTDTHGKRGIPVLALDLKQAICQAYLTLIKENGNE